MRFRSRYTPTELDALCDSHCRRHSPPGSWFTIPTNASAYYTSSYEGIYDVNSGRSTLKGVRAYNPVHHFRWQCTKPPGTPSAAGYGQMPGAEVVTDYELPAWLYFIIGVTPLGGRWQDVDVGRWVGSDLVDNAPIDTGSYERYKQCLPNMRSKANLTVFLYELSDIKRMFNVLPPKHLTFQGSKLQTWKDALKYANSLHLNYNFGWKPFVKDVKHTFDALSRFDERFAKFCNGAGSVFVHHAATPRTNSTTSETFCLDGSWASSKVVRTYATQYYTTLQGSYQAPDYGAGELKVRSYLDALGLNVSMANIWAVLPWSFVVDWFLNVGNQLDQFSSDWVQPWIQLHQACHSRKVIEAKSVATVQAVILTNPLEMAVCEAQAQCYTRSIGTGTSSWSISELTADRVRLLSSLFAGRLL